MQRPTVRSSRARPRHVPNHVVTTWTRGRLCLLGGMLLFLSTFSLLPILLFEQQQQTAPEVAVKPAVSVDQLVQKTRTILKHAQEHGKIPGDRTSLRNEQANQPLDSSTGVQALGTRNIPTTLDELKPDHGFVDKPLARGVAGRPVEQTPALQGGRRAHIDCDVNVDSLAYWNEPQGDYDVNFQSPFATEGEKYISFTPDRGGWNNIRCVWSDRFGPSV